MKMRRVNSTEEEDMMLPVKEAVKVSLATFGELFPSQDIAGIRLEEVRLDETEKNWEVTVSFKNPDFEDEITKKKSEPAGVETVFGPDISKVPMRHYKTITINADAGSLVGIRNEWDLM
jgi:hypothetical protein